MDIVGFTSMSKEVAPQFVMSEWALLAPVFEHEKRWRVLELHTSHRMCTSYIPTCLLTPAFQTRTTSAGYLNELFTLMDDLVDEFKVRWATRCSGLLVFVES